MMQSPPCVVDFQLAGYGCEFSPFNGNQIAIAASQYFGIIGNGRQLIVQKMPGSPQAQIIRSFDTQDGLYDCAWNESNAMQVVSASGDGSVKLFDLNTRDNFPVAQWHEHQTEVSGVHWNLVRKDMFVTASWDHTIKLFSPMSPQSIMTYAEHTYCVYQAIWSPRRATVFASASGDGTVRIWDTNSPMSIHRIAPAHDGEVLTLDWNKYNDNQLVTGSVDKTLRLWDLRNPGMPMMIMPGHQYAIRRVKFSPHSSNIIGSVSYDMTMCLWNTNNSMQPMFNRFDHHNEFVVGLDFNLFMPGEVATASWDGYCTIWNANGQMRPPKMMRRNIANQQIGGAMPPVMASPSMVEGGNMKKQMLK